MSESTPKKANVKWYNTEKGYGFLIVDSVETDVFVHIKKIRESGIHDPLKEGEKLTCTVHPGPRGLYAANIVRESANAQSAKS